MSQKKEDAARKAKHRVFPMLGAPEGRNVGSLKRRVRSHLVRWEIKKRTRPWHETDVEVKMSKMSKTPHVRSTFGSWHVQKVHGAVARSTCRSQSRQNTPPSTFGTWDASRATTAYTFSSSQLPKAVRTWCVLCILTSKCASRHNGAHFSTSQLPKVVRRWCALYILTWKRALRHNGVHFFIISVLRDFPTFLRTFIFFLLTFSFLISFFFSSLLWLFPSLLFICPYCRKFDI